MAFTAFRILMAAIKEAVGSLLPTVTGGAFTLTTSETVVLFSAQRATVPYGADGKIWFSATGYTTAYSDSTTDLWRFDPATDTVDFNQSLVNTSSGGQVYARIHEGTDGFLYIFCSINPAFNHMNGVIAKYNLSTGSKVWEKRNTTAAGTVGYAKLVRETATELWFTPVLNDSNQFLTLRVDKSTGNCVNSGLPAMSQPLHHTSSPWNNYPDVLRYKPDPTTKGRAFEKMVWEVVECDTLNYTRWTTGVETTYYSTPVSFDLHATDTSYVVVSGFARMRQNKFFTGRLNPVTGAFSNLTEWSWSGGNFLAGTDDTNWLWQKVVRIGDSNKFYIQMQAVPLTDLWVFIYDDDTQTLTYAYKITTPGGSYISDESVLGSPTGDGILMQRAPLILPAPGLSGASATGMLGTHTATDILSQMSSGTPPFSISATNTTGSYSSETPATFTNTTTSILPATLSSGSAVMTLGKNNFA